MNDIESAVAQHYGDADLLARIYGGLEAAGADLNRLRPEDLIPVEEFHMGGRKATIHAVEKMSLEGSQHVLDVGCGIGGAARYMTSRIGCRVTGVDLTPEYVEIARVLTEKTGLDGKVSFETASALNMPFERDTFDAALTIHVAMNIRERAELYGEIARVLKPGATLCVYDVMKKSDDAPAFPVPWADSAETSHLTTAEETGKLLEDAGFDVSEIEDRTELALDFFREIMAARTDGPPPLGIHLMMGANAPEKLKNTIDSLKDGRIAPVQMIARLK